MNASRSGSDSSLPIDGNELAASPAAPKPRSRRNSIIEWGTNPSGADIAIVGERRASAAECIRKKEKRLLYSQRFQGKFEILSADDDPINQASETLSFPTHRIDCRVSKDLFIDKSLVSTS